MVPVDTPCTKICTLDPRTQTCVGCGRTLAEIERWPSLSPADRISLMAILRQRLEKQASGN